MFEYIRRPNGPYLNTKYRRDRMRDQDLLNAHCVHCFLASAKSVSLKKIIGKSFPKERLQTGAVVAINV